MWLFGKGGLRSKFAGNDTELPLSNLSKTDVVLYLLLFVILTFASISFLRRFTNTDVPVWDGVLTAMSLVATVMMANRIVQHWWIWILTNVLYFYLYYHKVLYITMWFQIPLGVFSALGLIRWQREMRAISI